MTRPVRARRSLHTASAADDPRWLRVAERDRTADDVFWYSVATTGVYCRPSCPSRRANPKNVAFHETVALARTAGFRPCRRCHPDGLSVGAVNVAIVAKACRIIDEADQAPALASLAEMAELSPFYFHRLFRTVTGVTPRAYAAARRAIRLRAALADGATVTQGMHESGFNSTGRFYAAATGLLGMTPSRYRSGGLAETLRFAVGQCSLGAILVASSARGIAAILIGDDPDPLVRELQDRFPRAGLLGDDTAYEALVARTIGFVDSPRTGLDLPLDIRGTAFQRRVWQALQTIPAGTTVTYGDIASRVGAAGAARAVASACAANPLAVAVPCHRVVRHDGTLSGYRWGVERKRMLIEREAAPAGPVRPSSPDRGAGHDAEPRSATIGDVVHHHERRTPGRRIEADRDGSAGKRAVTADAPAPPTTIPD